MANELQVQHHTAGVTLYAILFKNGQAYRTDTAVFEDYATAQRSNYDIALTELGTASRFYAGTMPGVGAGSYAVVVYDRAGAAPAETDTAVATGTIEWNGSAIVPRTAVKLASDGLDAVDASEPTAKPTTFRGWMMWVVQRYRRARLTQTELKVQTEAGATVTTQALTSTHDVQTVGPPS